MHCPLNLSFKVAAGLIPIFFMGCSDPGLSMKVGASAGASTSGTEQSAAGGTQTNGSGGAGAGGASGEVSGVLSSSAETGGGGATVIGGTSVGGAGGQVSAGSQGGTGTGAAPGTGGASVMGGSAVAGTTSSTSTGGGTVKGGTTAMGSVSSSGGSTGGASSVSGSGSGARFPARFVGNIDTRGAIRKDFFQHWDQFTPENAGKWPSVQGTGKDKFNWSSLDAMYKYTEEHNIVFKETSFIWGSASASWLNNSNIMEAAKTWMTTFCERYPNTRLIDVVNEPLHLTPGFATGLGGGSRTTWDWVANSFKMAREACPNAVLILNDYNICEYATDHQNFISLVKAIKALDAPVDAIGCEGHDAAKIPVAKFKDFMDKLASETGLPIYITEFDIGLADDEAQRVQYADYFTMFWDNPNVKGVTLWGYITGATWRSNTGIMSDDGTMRPAMSWLMSFLGR